MIRLKTFLTLTILSGLALSIWRGELGEMLLFNTALSADGRGAVESYLNSKWAIY